VTKKRTLLLAWLKGNKSTKSQYYVEARSSLIASDTAVYDKKWRPLAFMVQKYGRSELLSLCQSGAITTRRHPKDPRFFQFCDETEGRHIEVTKRKEIARGSTGEVDRDNFLQFARTNWEGLTADEAMNWDNIPDGDDPNTNKDDDDGLARQLGLKKKGAAPKDSVDTEIDRQSQLGEKDDQSKAYHITK